MHLVANDVKRQPSAATRPPTTAVNRVDLRLVIILIIIMMIIIMLIVIMMVTAIVMTMMINIIIISSKWIQLSPASEIAKKKRERTYSGKC